MNIANVLTVSRIILAGSFIVFARRWGVATSCWALAIFTLAALTDWADGAIARKHDLITPFGQIMDPLADKILTLSAFILFALQGMVAGWMVAVIVVREVLVTVSRLDLMRSGKVIPAEKSGKIKTVVQMVTLFTILLIRVLWAWSGTGPKIKELEVFWRTGLEALMVLAMVLTVTSGLSYWQALKGKGGNA